MSESTNRLFFINIIFKSHDSTWTDRYLQSQDSRLTSLLKELGNSFWERYSKELVQCFEKNELLVRVKSIQSSEVHLTQIWKNEACFKNYKKCALQGISIDKLLFKKGIQVTENVRSVNEFEITEILAELQRFPHILQFISKRWRHPEMIVGDPLKQGRNYLPFPNEG